MIKCSVNGVKPDLPLDFAPFALETPTPGPKPEGNIMELLKQDQLVCTLCNIHPPCNH